MSILIVTLARSSNPTKWLFWTASQQTSITKHEIAVHYLAYAQFLKRQASRLLLLNMKLLYIAWHMPSSLSGKLVDFHYQAWNCCTLPGTLLSFLSGKPADFHHWVWNCRILLGILPNSLNCKLAGVTHSNISAYILPGSLCCKPVDLLY
jgi:hypothetical protein